MGEPAWRKARHRDTAERTPGTETSEYLQEAKEISIPKVVAIEMGRA